MFTKVSMSVIRVLIEPLWNWNLENLCPYRKTPCVLIEPLWNWNDLKSTIALKTSPGSNWTFMELKRKRERRYTFALSCSNWTFMELKQVIWQHFCITCKRVLIEPLWNWNDAALTSSRGAYRVLIEPLWNWNGEAPGGGGRFQSSNWTFMELKLLSKNSLSIPATF